MKWLMLALGAVLFASTAFAGAVFEDVGETPETAYTPPGTGLVTSITGNVRPPGDANLYRLFIPNPGLFSATTTGDAEFAAGLFLFDNAGNPVYGVSPFNNVATLPAGSLLGPDAAGLYLLGIAAAGNLPLGANGLLMFLAGAPGQVVGPAVNPGVLVDWTTGNPATGEYFVQITGARYPGDFIPEPATIMLLLSGLGALTLRRRRRA